MDFAPSPRALALQERRCGASCRTWFCPRNGDWLRWADAGAYPLDVIEPLKAQRPRRRPVESVLA
jgi:hypothetical protein